METARPKFRTSRRPPYTVIILHIVDIIISVDVANEMLRHFVFFAALKVREDGSLSNFA